MRKRSFLLSLLLGALIISGCGKEKTSMDIKYDVDQYVSLPSDYKKLSVSITGDYEVTDDKVNDYIAQAISNVAPYVADDTKTEVESDSVVNVNYVGKTDGKAFSGGSADNVNINVADNTDATSGSSYIEGFSSGLVGAKVGDTVDCNVTFPSDYSESSLAGKAAVFTFTVNFIGKKADITNINDEYTKTNFNIDTVDKFKDTAKSDVESSLKASKASAIRSAVVEKLGKESKVRYPADLVNMRVEEFKNRYREQNGIADDESLEDYVKKNLKISLKKFESEARKDVKSNLKTELIAEEIASKQNIKFDEKGYKKFIKNLKTQNKYSTNTELFEAYAPNSKSGEAYMKKMYVCTKAIDYVENRAEVTVSQE